MIDRFVIRHPRFEIYLVGRADDGAAEWSEAPAQDFELFEAQALARGTPWLIEASPLDVFAHASESPEPIEGPPTRPTRPIDE